MIVTVVEGFDAKPVANQDQFVTPRIMECEGKHSLQSFQELHAPGLIGMQDSFAIRMRGEAMAELFQFDAQLSVVIYLAVGNQCEAMVFVF